MSGPVRAYLAPVIVGGIAAAVSLGVLALGQILRPRRTGSTDASRPGGRR